MRQIKYTRLQVDGHTIVEFVNGSRACSCGLIRGELPDLRGHPCLIDAPHREHDWTPIVVDPDHERVLHVGLATLTCPGR